MHSCCCCLHCCCFAQQPAAGNCNFSVRNVAYEQHMAYAAKTQRCSCSSSVYATFYIPLPLLHSCLFFPLAGIINRGDSFRRRRSRSNSLAPVSPMHARNAMAGLNGGGGGGSSLGLGSNYNGGGSSNNGFGDAPGQDNHQQPVEFYRVEMLGSAGVGKQALVSQFRTSDCINAYDGPGKLPQCQRHLSCLNWFPFPPSPPQSATRPSRTFQLF